jgi:NAD(P)-dependent dehydrogenase (short-subunit alcohol dehydrogenase family)
MSQSLEGKRTIITGSGAGIGEATAHIFAERGAAVLIADIDSVRADRVAADITAKGGVALPFAVDVSDEEQTAAMIEYAALEFGGLDVLYNNAAHVAGEVMRADGQIAELDASLFADVLRVNVMGPMLGAKHAVPHLKRAGGGVILVTSSLSAFYGQFRESMYGTSKSALTGMVRYLATQYGRFGIRAVGIAPGCMITEDDAIAKGIDAYLPVLRRHTPSPRLGVPADIGNLAAFLASDQAAYINGITIPVDGGFSAHFASYADDLDLLRADAEQKS